MSEALLKDPKRHGYDTGAKAKRIIGLLQDPEVFPPYVALQFFGDEYKRDVIVYSLNGPVVRLKLKTLTEGQVFIQCLGGVHFNHVRVRGEMCGGSG